MKRSINRIGKVGKKALAIVLLLILVLSTPLSYTETAHAADVRIVPTTVVHWVRTSTLDGFEPNKRYRLMLVWDGGSGLNYMSSSSIKLISPPTVKADSSQYGMRFAYLENEGAITAYSSKYKKGTVWKSGWVTEYPSDPVGQAIVNDFNTDVAVYPNAGCFNGKTDDFYTLDGYRSWYIEPCGENYCNLYVDDAVEDRKLITTDSSDMCLTWGPVHWNHMESPDGKNAWTLLTGVENNKVSFYYRNDSFVDYNNFFGYSGRYLFALSRSTVNVFLTAGALTNPQKGGTLSKRLIDYGQFDMYVGTEETNWTKIECGSGDACVIASGQTMNINGNLLLPDGAKLIVEPGAVLSITGRFINNGEILNYGTVIVKNNGLIYSIYPEESTNTPGRICNYGSKCTYADSKLKPEGNFIIMSNGVVALNTRSNPFELNKGAQLINGGLLISPMGFTVDESTFINNGNIAMGWGIKTIGINPGKINYKTDGYLFGPEDKSYCEYPTSFTFRINNKNLSELSTSDRCYFYSPGNIGTVDGGYAESDIINISDAIKMSRDGKIYKYFGY